MTDDDDTELCVSWVSTMQRGNFVETVYPAMTVRQFLRSREVPRYLPDLFVFRAPRRLCLLDLPVAVVVSKRTWWSRARTWLLGETR